MDLFCIAIAVIDLIYEHSSTVPFTNVCNINKTERKKKRILFKICGWKLLRLFLCWLLSVQLSVFNVINSLLFFFKWAARKNGEIDYLKKSFQSSCRIDGNSRPRKDPLWLPFPVDRTTWGGENWFQKLRGSKQTRLTVYHILTLGALNNQGGIFLLFGSKQC